MQANKQDKIVWQQLQITAMELRKNFFKVYLYIYAFFVILFWCSTKIDLFHFLVFNQDWPKKLFHFDEDLSWFLLKINKKKVLHFVVFKPHPPKKTFCAPSTQTHYSGAGPASNCLVLPKPAQVSTLVPNWIFAFFSSLFAYLITFNRSVVEWIKRLLLKR